MEYLPYCAAEIAIIFFIVVVLIKTTGHRRNLPPGPLAFPLIGNALQIGKRPGHRFLEWSKIYGPIFRIKLGTCTAIVINDSTILRKVFDETASTGRADDHPFFDLLTEGPYGMTMASGQTWKEQRRFTVQTLRSFGFSMAVMESYIQAEALGLQKYLSQLNNKPISGNNLFISPVVNNLWHIVSGERFEWESGHVGEIVHALDMLFETGNNCYKTGVFFAPILRHVFPEALGWNKYVEAVNSVRKIVKEYIQQHMETFDPLFLRDFIDHQILEMKNAKYAVSSFYGDKGYMNTIATVVELFIAGSEGTAATLSWAMLYLSQHWKVQAKIHAEITRVLGSRAPSLTDRDRLPYLEATMLEIMRIRPAGPLGLPHKMLADLKLSDYVIPKDAYVFANLYGIQNDPDVWSDPDTFQPERFLRKDGTCERRHPQLVTFSVGLRKCIGENLAKDTVFLFLANILQKFEVLPADENIEPDFEPDEGVSSKPKSFMLVFKQK